MDSNLNAVDFIPVQRNIRNNQNHLETPKMIGYFSVDRNREFLGDATNLKYLNMPMEVNLDLNKGINTFCAKPESVRKEKMEFLLKFILNNLELLKVKSDVAKHRKLLNADVICSRGKLAKVMCNSRKWSLIASKYKGNIYICQPDGDEEENVFGLPQVYGFKFEQYLTTGNPLDDPDTDAPVIESEEFYGVFKSKFSNTALLYNAEMDALDSKVKVDLSKTNLNALQFVEIKSCLRTKRIELNYCNWWAQSYLARVPTILVGYRDEHGIVQKIDCKQVTDLANMKKKIWSPDTCFDVLKSFLRVLELAMENVDSAHTVYKFDYDPILNKTFPYEVFEAKNEYSFLPDWYTEVINIQNY